MQVKEMFSKIDHYYDLISELNFDNDDTTESLELCNKILSGGDSVPLLLDLMHKSLIDDEILNTSGNTINIRKKHLTTLNWENW